MHLGGDAPGLELDELVGDGVGGLASVDLGDDPFPGIVGAAGGRMVLAEGLGGGAEDHPLGGPLEPPCELSLAGADVGLPAVPAVVAAVPHVGELVVVELGLGEPPAVLAHGVVRRVVGVGLLTSDLREDLDDLLPLLHGHVDALSELALGVELVGPDDLAVDPEGIHGVEERLDEVVGVVLVLAAGAGYPGYGHPDVLLVLRGEEVVAFPEGVEGIDQVDQLDLFAEGLHRAPHGLAGDGLPQTSNVDDTGRADPRRD